MTITKDYTLNGNRGTWVRAAQAALKANGIEQTSLKIVSRANRGLVVSITLPKAQMRQFRAGVISGLRAQTLSL